MGGAYAERGDGESDGHHRFVHGRTATITLANGDTAGSIVRQVEYGIRRQRAQAHRRGDGGNTVQITGANYGSNAKITVAFAERRRRRAANSGSSSAIGGADDGRNDNGKSATVSRLLTADAPVLGDTNDAQGLALLFTGTGPLSER